MLSADIDPIRQIAVTCVWISSYSTPQSVGSSAALLWRSATNQFTGTIPIARQTFVCLAGALSA